MNRLIKTLALIPVFFTCHSICAWAQDNPQAAVPAQEAAPKSDSSGIKTIVLQENGTKAFVNEAYAKRVESQKSPVHIQLKMKHKHKSELIDHQTEHKEYKYPVLNRTEDGVTYQGIVYKRQYDYMYTQLLITNSKSEKTLYDLSAFGQHETDPIFIRFAILKDDVLYVSLSHKTYKDSNPDTAFILAINPLNGDILWRSDNIVCNTNNFLIIKDTIVCGYGYTKEPDFIYTLDLYSGKVLNSIPIKSGPGYFIRQDNLIHVAAYDTNMTLSYK